MEDIKSSPDRRDLGRANPAQWLQGQRSQRQTTPPLRRPDAGCRWLQQKPTTFFPLIRGYLSKMPTNRQGNFFFFKLTQGSALSQPSSSPHSSQLNAQTPGLLGRRLLSLSLGNNARKREPPRFTLTQCAQTRPGRRRRDPLSLLQTLSSPTDGLLAPLKASDNNRLHAAFVLPRGSAAPRAQFLPGSCLHPALRQRPGSRI